MIIHELYSGILEMVSIWLRKGWRYDLEYFFLETECLKKKLWIG
jgi:hypothetical protein